MSDDAHLLDRCPLTLPHLELGGNGWTWLGEPLEADRIGWPAVLARCDGTRPLRHFDRPERQVVVDAHGAGLVRFADRPDAAVGVADRRVVVSPHPDDALLSLGAHLVAGRPTIVDVFSDEVWTHRAHYRRHPQQTAALILAEERAACRVIGADPVVLGLTDAPQRAPWSEGFLVDEARPELAIERDRATFDDLCTRLAPLVQPASRIYVPLAIGGHVDHLLCSEAILHLLREGVIDAERTWFYEDVPPCLFQGSSTARARIERRAPGRGVLVDQVLTCVDAELATKGEALGAYRLQVQRGLVSRTLRYNRSIAEHGADGGERIWRLDG